MMHEVNPDKFKAVAVLNVGDKVKLTNGDIAEFERIKQKKFIGIINGKHYDIPVNMFVEVVEKATVSANQAPSQPRVPNTPARASINGITLSSLKTWESRDGGGMSANVLMDGRGIGNLYDDGNGGGIQVEIAKVYLDQIKLRMESYFESYPSRYPTTDIFFDELANLTENEKFFKKGLAKGFNVFAILWKAQRTEMFYDVDKYNAETQSMFRSEEALLADMKEKGYKDSHVFRSVDDFAINTMKNKSQPEIPSEQTNVRQGESVSAKYFGRK